MTNLFLIYFLFSLHSFGVSGNVKNGVALELETCRIPVSSYNGVDEHRVATVMRFYV